jgi:hypothetical protein
MQPALTVTFAAVLIFAVILGLVFVFLQAGRRIGARKRALDPEGAKAGLRAIEGAVFGLMGLLLAFTFSGAASRFEARRDLIVKETNAIGTAYLRLDLLPPAAQPKLREDFRNYVDARLTAYQKLPDVDAYNAELAKAVKLQGEIWTNAVAVCREGNAITALVLSALNEMIDITTTRAVANLTHPPAMVFVMLFVLLFASSLLAGYGMGTAGSASQLHVVGYAVIMAITVYVILDIEFPRVGIVRIDSVDQILSELRQSMK